MMIATATAERIVRREIRESESDLYDMLARTFDDPDACTIDRANSAIKCESQIPSVATPRFAAQDTLCRPPSLPSIAL